MAGRGMTFDIIGQMKLSQDSQLYVEGLYTGKRLKLSPKYRSEIERLKTDFWMPKADRIRELLKVHTEYAQELADFTVDAYLNAYRAEGGMPDANDIGEITSKLSYWLRTEVASAVRHLPLDLALSTTTEQIIDDTMRIADKELRNAVRESDLQSKREEVKKMEQARLIEKEKQRYRLLRLLYDEAGGNANVEIPDGTLQATMGLTQDEFYALHDYLTSEGLVNAESIGTTAITHYGIKEIEASIKHPTESTAHFQSYTIQNIYGTVHNIQAGHHNVQSVIINVNPEFDKALAKMIELVTTSTLTELQKEETVRDLQRVAELAQKPRTPEVLELAKQKLELAKGVIAIGKDLAFMAAPFLEYLYQWFQG
jgi:hypothetical protein